MTNAADRWRRVEQVLDAALTADPALRASVLDESCSGDPELRAEVETLLARLQDATGFLSTPPAGAAAALVNEATEGAAASLVGRRIGPYRIERELGRGGMSRVFLASRVDGEYEQQVAIKLLRPGLDSDLDLERLRAERQILAKLNHPNIARLLDGGVTTEGQPYLVLEFVDGMTIDRYCSDQALSLAERLDLFATVARATEYAHRNLVVHRDLKPSNIFVASDGTVKLLDFGLAKLLEQDDARGGMPATRTGQRWMTPEYAAPEQIRGESITTLTDVYQLGVVLYELVTGRLPFPAGGRGLHVLEDAILNTEPPLPSSTGDIGRALRGDVDAIVMKAIRKEPDRRYPSVAAMSDDIQRYRDGRTVLARPDSRLYRTRKFVRRHRAGVAAAALAIVAVVGATVRERSLRAAAETEASRAKAVQDYLVSVFDIADPYAPPGLGSKDVSTRTLLDRGAARVDSVLAGHAANQAEIRTVFGHVYSNLGLYDQAVGQFRRSLEQRRALYGARHPAVAEAMAELGFALMLQGKLDDAEPLLREALAQRRALLGSQDTSTAGSIDHMATLLRERNDFNGADTLYREALAIRRAVLGPRHAAVAASLSNLGLLLYWKARYDEAEPLYREAMSIQEETLGTDHPRVAQTMQNLAQTMQQRRRIDEAEALFRRALAVKRKSLGNAHPSVTISLNNLAMLLVRDRGQFDEADTLVREALALDRQIFGENHAYVAASLDNLANILREKGDFDEAQRVAEQALSVNRAVFGAKHNSIALNLNSIAGILRLKGHPERAIPLLRQSVALYRELLGDGHPFVMSVDLNLARALREAGQLPEAERIFRTVAGALDETKPATRPQLIGARVGLGQTLTGTGRAKEARPLIEQGLAMSLGQFGPEHLVSADAKLALGSCLLELREYAKAEPLLREAYAVAQKRARAQPRMVARAAEALGRVYIALGRPDEARNYVAAQ